MTDAPMTPSLDIDGIIAQRDRLMQQWLAQQKELRTLNEVLKKRKRYITKLKERIFVSANALTRTYQRGLADGAAQEREACATIAKNQFHEGSGMMIPWMAGDIIAEAIRARSKDKT